MIRSFAFVLYMIKPSWWLCDIDDDDHIQSLYNHIYNATIMMTMAWVPRGPILVTGVWVWRSRRPLDFKSWNIWSFLKRKSFSRLRWRCTVRSAPSPGFCIANILLKIFRIFCLKYLLCELSCQVSPGQSIERLSPFKPELRRTVTVSIEAQKEALKMWKLQQRSQNQIEARGFSDQGRPLAAL